MEITVGDFDGTADDVKLTWSRSARGDAVYIVADDAFVAADDALLATTSDTSVQIISGAGGEYHVGE